jgi:sugar-specific transcriptional regulator TrmB
MRDINRLNLSSMRRQYMLDPLFTQLGLGANEVKVYLALAEMGKASAALIAKKTGTPRSTVYTVLEGLLKRGVVSLEQGQEISFFVANQPDALTRMVEEERREGELRLAAKAKAAAELVPMLQPFFKRENYSVPKLQFFEGTANVNNMLYQCCRQWQESISAQDFTWWGYQDHHLVETYREWLDYYWASMDPKERIWLFSNRSETEKKLKGRIARRVIKVIPKKFQFSSTVWVLGEYVVTIMTRQKPHYAFQLQDAVFAANQRLMFQMLWGLM